MRLFLRCSWKCRWVAGCVYEGGQVREKCRRAEWNRCNPTIDVHCPNGRCVLILAVPGPSRTLCCKRKQSIFSLPGRLLKKKHSRPAMLPFFLNLRGCAGQTDGGGRRYKVLFKCLSKDCFLSLRWHCVYICLPANFQTGIAAGSRLPGRKSSWLCR